MEWIVRQLNAALDASRPEQGHAAVIVAGVHDDSSRSHCLRLSIVLSRAGCRIINLPSEVTAAEVQDLVERAVPDAVVLVFGSGLADVTAAATVERLAALRGSGMWRGAVLATGARSGSAVPSLPFNPRIGLGCLKQAIDANRSELCAMRSQ